METTTIINLIITTLWIVMFYGVAKDISKRI